jgi:uncharacterized membrane protein
MSYPKSASLKPFSIRIMSLTERYRFLRSELDRLLICSMLFSCLLAVYRVIHTGRSNFLFLVWNLFLALIPYALSGWMTSFRRETGKVLGILVVAVWLLFIPNTFYILTDLYHLGDGYNDRGVPQWFDLIMILSFAWNGLLLGILSIRQMEKVVLPWMVVHGWAMRRRGGKAGAWLFVYPIMWLNALGVYTGRYLRFNSWEIISNPFRLLGDIIGIIIHPLRNHYAWDMIFCFSILMTLIYVMMKRVSEALV